MSSKALAIRPESVDLERWSEIVYQLATRDKEDDDPDEPTLRWMSRRFDMTQREALSVIAHPQFAEFYHNLKKAVARSEFDRVAFDRLLSIVERGAPRDSINAVKLFAPLVGVQVKQPKKPIQINFSMDAVIRNMDGAEEATVVDEDVVDAALEEYEGM